ncbi:hypothetical protein MSG28_001966 [Choristoneura fumiferana]|uniref:Uncharacterized protein n=1 Tax=Choristoneura fumiferana TaxID=7141 RepID=A0ACC0JTX9_CHOFU|nr:hypothetical protein MSG28_001966 [Choristoneura fumiferana]
MKMTMSTSATMSARVHRKVMRAPHKRVLPGKMAHAGKMVHPGKLAHPGKLTHLGKFGKLPHYTHTHTLRPPEPCENSNDSGLGPDHDQRHLSSINRVLVQELWNLVFAPSFRGVKTYVYHSGLERPLVRSYLELSALGSISTKIHLRLSLRVRHRIAGIQFGLDSEEWDQPGCKRRRDMAVKVECDDANDAYPCPPPHAPPAPALTLPTPAATRTLTTLTLARAGVAAESRAPEKKGYEIARKIIRASCSLSSPSAEQSRLAYQETYRSCGKLGSAGKYAGGGKLAGAGGKLSGKLGGKLGGKYGGKLAQALARRRALVAMSPSGPPGLAAPLAGRSRDGMVELQILCQPESQHRARYQTEGSRGAVKDNSGNGFPIVKLIGYDKPAVLQVFIGTDTGRVAPHMFYQACRVSGKNSTSCKERKDDGTVVIEIDLEPTKNWQVTCDCVGILKVNQYCLGLAAALSEVVALPDSMIGRCKTKEIN